MIRNAHSGWHEGGTRPPSRKERGDSSADFCGWGTSGAVPDRATLIEFIERKTAELSGTSQVNMASGTGWHESPSASVRVHRRA